MKLEGKRKTLTLDDELVDSPGSKIERSSAGLRDVQDREDAGEESESDESSVPKLLDVARLHSKRSILKEIERELPGEEVGRLTKAKEVRVSESMPRRLRLGLERREKITHNLHVSSLSGKRHRSLQSRREDLDKLLWERNGDGSLGFKFDFDDEIRSFSFDHSLE